MFSLLSFGFLLGIRHALESDHIATVASLASTHANRRQMIRQGLAWGIGHSITLFLFGFVVLWVDTLIPNTLASGLEMAVGALMIMLGIDVIRRAWKSNFHFHTHQHDDGKIHLHAHSHTDQEMAKHDQSESHQHKHVVKEQFPLRALLIGLVHGMAGSAALILLFLDRIEQTWQGLLYIGLFSVGSIAGMFLFSIVISVPLGITARKVSVLHRAIQYTVGLMTMGLGLSLFLSQLNAFTGII